MGFHDSLGKVNSKAGGFAIKWNQWKVLHNAIKDHGDEGHARNKKVEVWEALDKVFLYCEESKWTSVELEDYKSILNIFKKSMIDAWTNRHITNYIVRSQPFLMFKKLSYS